jgi:hypothetical protein
MGKFIHKNVCNYEEREWPSLIASVTFSKTSQKINDPIYVTSPKVVKAGTILFCHNWWFLKISLPM